MRNAGFNDEKIKFEFELGIPSYEIPRIIQYAKNKNSTITIRTHGTYDNYGNFPSSMIEYKNGQISLQDYNISSDIIYNIEVYDKDNKKLAYWCKKPKKDNNNNNINEDDEDDEYGHNEGKWIQYDSNKIQQ